jgi:hypothetical protein
MAVHATYSIPQVRNIFIPKASIRTNMSKIIYAVHRLGSRECRRQIISILPSLTKRVKTAFNSIGNPLCSRTEFIIRSYMKIRVFWDNITSKNADNSILSGIRNRGT